MLYFLFGFLIYLVSSRSPHRTGSPNYSNMTEICVNLINSTCKEGVFEVTKCDNLDYYFFYSEEATVYIVNDLHRSVSIDLGYLSLKKLKFVGLTNASNVNLNIYEFDSEKCDLYTDNVYVTFVSVQGNSIPFRNAFFNRTSFFSTSKTFKCNHLISDPYSLNEFPISAKQIDLRYAFYHLSEKTIETHYLISINSNSANGEIDLNYVGLNGDYQINLKPNGLSMTFKNNSETNYVDIEFKDAVKRVNFILNDDSVNNTLSLYSNSRMRDYWLCGFYKLRINHRGTFRIDLFSSEFYFASISANSLFFSSLSNSICRIMFYNSSNDENKPCLIYADAKVTLFLNSESNSDAKFEGEGKFVLDSELEINNYRKLSTPNLFFGRKHPRIKVAVTKNASNAMIDVATNINFTKKIIIMPTYNESLFSIPEDVPSLMNKKLFTLCAPNIVEGNFVIVGQSDYNLPPGFTIDDMSFDLITDENKKCISLVFQKDPASFTTDCCVFKTNRSLCRSSPFDSSKGQSPFKSRIDTHFINIEIVEDLPEDYIFNLSEITEKREINFFTSTISLSDQETNLKINVFDNRLKAKGTSLIFSRTSVRLNKKATDYDRLYLMNGAIIENLNFSKTSSCEIDFAYAEKYASHFYKCSRVEIHHVQTKQIFYDESSWKIYLKDDQKPLVIDNGHKMTLSFDPHQSLLSLKSNNSNEIKPISFKIDSPDPITISINMTGVESVIAAKISLESSDASNIFISTPTNNVPIDITKLRGSTSFERMKNIITYSSSESVSSADFINSLVIEEPDVSFLGVIRISDQTTIPAIFPQTYILSDVYIISHIKYQDQITFGKPYFKTNQLVVGRGVSATIVYGVILQGITIGEDSVLTLFHVQLKDSRSKITFIISLGQKVPCINLIEYQRDLDMPTKTPLFIEDDDDSEAYAPKEIVIMHKLAIQNQQKPQINNKNENAAINGYINESTEDCIINLRPVDDCQQLLKVVAFEPAQISNTTGIFTFQAVCKPSCLAVISTYEEISHTDSPNKGQDVTIIVICTLSGVLIIAIIAIIVLVIKKKKQEDPISLMKNTLLLPPSDM